MICSKCKKAIEEDSKVCPYCGVTVGSGIKFSGSDKGQSQTIFENDPSLSPALLDGERVLATFKSGLWDMGIVAFLLRQKGRIVITTYRAFQLSKGLLFSDIKCLSLRNVEAIGVTSKLNLKQFLIGAVLLLFVLFSGNAGASIAGWGSDSPPDSNSYDSYPAYSSSSLEKGFFDETGGMFLKVIILAVSIILILTAKKRGLLVATGNERDGVIFLSFRRLKPKDSKHFLDVISKAKENLEK